MNKSIIVVSAIIFSSSASSQSVATPNFPIERMLRVESESRLSQDVVKEKPRSSTAYSRDAAQPTRASGTALYSQKEFQDIFFSIRDIARKEGYESALKIPSYKIPGLPCTALDSHPKGVRVKGGDLFNGLSIFYDCGSFAMEVATTDFTMATDQQMMVKIAEETSAPITGGSISKGFSISNKEVTRADYTAVGKDVSVDVVVISDRPLPNARSVDGLVVNFISNIMTAPLQKN
ncbi:hypothetical protein [Xanthomonas campestris]|uniref:hypothetical protein n=1 Tax=Xanthomonas campestris TaxID=339 RepID=UPI001E40151F|nr:hypothetical protein [Xanthomonas campestris]MCC4603356.1 hypothetical protein [Xanthomonas campestris pv. parthenii]